MSDFYRGAATLQEFFGSFERTACRFEVRRAYGMEAAEALCYREFLAGADPGAEWMRPWLDLIGRQVATGKRVQRVRVTDTPPSDYLRFEMYMTRNNAEAGEDIRYLHRLRALRLGLPSHDYWLFDSAVLVTLEFDSEDQFLGVVVDRGDATVKEHVGWWDAAVRYAMKLDSYAATVGAESVLDRARAVAERF